MHPLLLLHTTSVTMEAAAQDIFEKHATGKFNNTLKIFTDVKKGSGIEPRQRWVEPFYVTSSGLSKNMINRRIMI